MSTRVTPAEWKAAIKKVADIAAHLVASLFADLSGADDKIRALEAKLASRRLTPKEQRTLKWAAAWGSKSSYKNQAATLLSLLERLK